MHDNDGNSRLARFLLTREFEDAGIPALVIPVSSQAELRKSHDKVLLANDLVPLIALLKKAHAKTDRLLAEFNSREFVEALSLT